MGFLNLWEDYLYPRLKACLFQSLFPGVMWGPGGEEVVCVWS